MGRIGKPLRELEVELEPEEQRTFTPETAPEVEPVPEEAPQPQQQPVPAGM